MSGLTWRARVVIIISGLLVLCAVGLSAARLFAYIGDRSAYDRKLASIAEQNQRNGNLLVDCVTPGPSPGPVTGHPCWDRLHDTKSTDGAVALIVDNIYCDQRRAQAKLPAVPDPTQPCRFQTDPSIYPGSSKGTP
jgi:hypothetical protein